LLDRAEKPFDRSIDWERTCGWDYRVSARDRSFLYSIPDAAFYVLNLSIANKKDIDRIATKEHSFCAPNVVIQVHV
jgi:hypothetical protein